MDTPAEIEEYRAHAIQQLEQQIAPGGYLADQLAAAREKLARAREAPYAHDMAVRMEGERVMEAQAPIDEIRQKIERIRYGTFTSKSEIRAVWG